jgi:hypothetical protein
MQELLPRVDEAVRSVLLEGLALPPAGTPANCFDLGDELGIAVMCAAIFGCSARTDGAADVTYAALSAAVRGVFVAKEQAEHFRKFGRALPMSGERYEATVVRYLLALQRRM